MKTIISTNDAPQAIGPYSQAVKANGFVFCSGQIPLKADGSMVQGDARAQTVQILQNLEALLKAAGCSFEDVVSSTVYLTDLNDFAAMNEVYGPLFPQNPPARVTIQVAALPKGANVEIAMIAVAKM